MTLQDRVSAPVVRPVFVGWLDFKDDPVYGWNGPGNFAPTGTGDPVLDANIFLPAEGAFDISDFAEDLGGGRPVSIKFAVGDSNDLPVVRQIVRDRRAWQMRRAKFWLFFLMPDEASVYPEFVQLFSGFMVQAGMTRVPGQGAIIDVECDVDLRAASGAPARLIDHARFWAGDTWSSFLLALARGPVSGSASGPGRAPKPGNGPPSWKLPGNSYR